MKVLITGGAGFIGCNAASRLLARGAEVVLIDDLSRPGAERNLEWLKSQGDFEFHRLDVRDFSGVRSVFQTHRNASLALHLAAQVAVTTSIADPRTDFEINALGTLNVLEAAHQAGLEAPLIYASTNKVYGEMRDIPIVDSGRRYEYANLPYGIPEEYPLDFHSPYGCSKGSADQYVRDYHRIYGLNTVVFRQSCIYGPRQFGIEDQGWVAWFMIAVETGRPLTIYGDGKQVRDLLQVEDLLDAFEAAARNIESTAGMVYNLGGGPGNAVSLIDVLEFLEQRIGRRIERAGAPARAGDQRVYVSDIRRAERDFGWTPKVDWRTGLKLLHGWVADNRRLFA